MNIVSVFVFQPVFKNWWRSWLWHYFCFQTPDRVWDTDGDVYKYNQKLRDNAALWMMLFTTYYDCGKEACRLFPVPSLKKKKRWHKQGFFCESCEQGGGIFDSPPSQTQRQADKRSSVCCPASSRPWQKGRVLRASDLAILCYCVRPSACWAMERSKPDETYTPAAAAHLWSKSN